MQTQTILSFINLMKIKLYFSCVANIGKKKTKTKPPGNFNTASKLKSSEFLGKHMTPG